MKKKFLLMVTLLTGLLMSSCSMSTEKLAKEVKKSMNETWRKQADEGVNAKCNSVALVHENGNKYSGTAEIESDGETETVSLDVIYDGDSFRWQIVDE